MNIYQVTLLINVIFYIVDLLNRKNSINSSSIKFLARRSLFTFLFAIVWLIVSNKIDIHSINYKNVLEVILCSVLCGLGLYSFIEANKYLKFTNVLFIHAIGQILHQLFGFILFEEIISLEYVISFLIALIGVLLQAKIPSNRKGLMWALISTLAWTIGYSLMSIPLKEIDLVLSVVIVEFTILIFSSLIVVYRAKSIKENLNKITWVYIIIGLFTILGSYLINYSYKNFAISSIGWINLIFLPLIALFNRIRFRERLSRVEIISNLLLLSAFLFYVLNK
ncbi:MAG: EamA family transporter [bacterium]